MGRELPGSENRSDRRRRRSPRGVLVVVVLLVLGLVAAVVGRRMLAVPQSKDETENRSDRNHWNNDASLQLRD